MKREIYFHQMPHPYYLNRIKQRFHLTPITVNGVSTATVDEGDEEVFNRCAEMGFFQIRNRKYEDL